MDKDISRKVSIIAEAVTGLSYYKWSRIKTVIDKKYSSASARIKLEDAEELKNAIEVEF